MLPLFPLVQKLSFEERHAELRKYVCGTRYASQKDRLRSDFEEFLAARASGSLASATAPSLQAASSQDVIRFLFHREKGGRTTVHALACPHLGEPGFFDCECPRRLHSAN